MRIEILDDQKRSFSWWLWNAALGLVLGFVIVPLVANSEETNSRTFVIPEPIDKQIQEILREPKKVYYKDVDKEKITNERIDEFFGQYFDIRKAGSVTSKKTIPSTFRLNSEESRPIQWDREKTGIGHLKTPGSIWYTKQPQKRGFLKELNIPTKKILTDKRAIRIASTFIKENKFATETKIEKLKPSGVHTHKKQEIKPDGSIGAVLILSQRVTFIREIDGQPVLNAKQTVNLHADRGELVGYKKIRWAEILPKGDNAQYRPKDEIVSEIEKLLSKASTEYTIKKVVPAMYQTSDMIVPVLAVYTAKQVTAGKAKPIQETFLISLVDGLSGAEEQRQKDKRRPSKALKQ